MQTSCLPINYFNPVYPTILSSICPVNINMSSAAELVLSGQADHSFWRDATSDYDAADWQKRITSSITNFIQENAPWLGLSSPPPPPSTERPIKALDYACGPGVVSQSLLPYMDNILGLDINPKQVEEYNRRARGSGLSEQVVKAETVNILADDVDDKYSAAQAEYSGFSYAFCSLAFHHIDDPAGGIKKLAARVKSDGGQVVIIEFVGREADGRVIGLDSADSEAEKERRAMNKEYEKTSHDNNRLMDLIKKSFQGKQSEGGHDHSHGHSHEHSHGEHGHHHHHGHGESGEGEKKHGHGPHGFKVEQMEKMFRDAGLVDVDSKVYPEKLDIMGFGGWEIFMTKGKKA